MRCKQSCYLNIRSLFGIFFVVDLKWKTTFETLWILRFVKMSLHYKNKMLMTNASDLTGHSVYQNAIIIWIRTFYVGSFIWPLQIYISNYKKPFEILRILLFFLILITISIILVILFYYGEFLFSSSYLPEQLNLHKNVMRYADSF